MKIVDEIENKTFSIFKIEDEEEKNIIYSVFVGAAHAYHGATIVVPKK